MLQHPFTQTCAHNNNGLCPSQETGLTKRTAQGLAFRKWYRRHALLVFAFLLSPLHRAAMHVHHCTYSFGMPGVGLDSPLMCVLYENVYVLYENVCAL